MVYRLLPSQLNGIPYEGTKWSHSPDPTILLVWGIFSNFPITPMLIQWNPPGTLYDVNTSFDTLETLPPLASVCQAYERWMKAQPFPVPEVSKPS